VSRYLDWHNEPVSVLNLSVRARNCLAYLRIATVGELVERSADQLLEHRSFGETSLREFRAALAALGLSLRGE
jgi:DNA-directed RNA polymerase subunit alpha